MPAEVDDRAWADQIGPVHRAADVAALLGTSAEAVSADGGLLRLESRDGQGGYPVFQFDGRRPLPGIRDIVHLLAPAVASTWTIASWLTSEQPSRGGQRPLDRLRAGDTEAVLAEARRMARAMVAGQAGR
jgi:hypothetical protein